MSQVDWIIIGVLFLLGLILPKRNNTEKADRIRFIENHGLRSPGVGGKASRSS